MKLWNEIIDSSANTSKQKQRKFYGEMLFYGHQERGDISMKREVTPFLRKMEFDDSAFGREHGEGWNSSPFSYNRFKGKNVCHR